MKQLPAFHTQAQWGTQQEVASSRQEVKWLLPGRGYHRTWEGVEGSWDAHVGEGGVWSMARSERVSKGHSMGQRQFEGARAVLLGLGKVQGNAWEAAQVEGVQEWEGKHSEGWEKCVSGLTGTSAGGMGRGAQVGETYPATCNHPCWGSVLGFPIDLGLKDKNLGKRHVTLFL